MPSDIGQIVIGVDLDGECANFSRRMREIAAEWFERALEKLTKEVAFGLRGAFLHLPNTIVYINSQSLNANSLKQFQ